MTATIDDTEETFRAALEADAGGPAGAQPPPPPPERDLDAPHGRDPATGEPLTPYGISSRTGRPRQKPAGPGRGGKRPQAAADKPRVQDGPPPAGDGGRDYTAELDELGDGLWMLLSGFPVPIAGLKIRVQAQAAILHAHKPVLVRSVNTVARHNAAVAARIDALTAGNAAWILPAMFGLAPFVGQSLAMWRAPAADIGQLAAANEAQFTAQLEILAGQIQQMNAAQGYLDDAAADAIADHYRIQDQAAPA